MNLENQQAAEQARHARFLPTVRILTGSCTPCTATEFAGHRTVTEAALWRQEMDEDSEQDRERQAGTGEDVPVFCPPPRRPLAPLA